MVDPLEQAKLQRVTTINIAPLIIVRIMWQPIDANAHVP